MTDITHRLRSYAYNDAEALALAMEAANEIDRLRRPPVIPTVRRLVLGRRMPRELPDGAQMALDREMAELDFDGDGFDD